MEELDLEKHLLPTDKEIEEVHDIFEKGEQPLDRIFASSRKLDAVTLGLECINR